MYWKITNLLKKHDIGEEHLFFVHSSKGFLQEIKQMQQRKILWINSTLNLKSKHLQFNNNLEWGRRQKVIVDKKLRYHYACLYANRPARHRHYLIKKLHEKNLLNFGKCSLKPCPDFGDTYQLPMDDLLPKGKPNTHITNTLYQETDVFRDIFLWVAAETYCPNGYPYFTEKTVKPIMYKRPFISYGNPGTLTYLRDCGFKTFDNFWDESYDDEKDDDKKIDMITDIIENLCQKNINELDQLYGQMESILEFNKNLLIKTHWRHDLIKFLS